MHDPRYSILGLFVLKKLKTKFLYFSMEGGELFERIQSKGDNGFTEKGKLILTIYVTKFATLLLKLL